MKQRIRTKRLWVVVFCGMVAATLALMGFYFRNLEGARDQIFSREHNRRYCGRCGFQEWSISSSFFGFRSSSHFPVEGQKKDFAGVEQSSCQHFFLNIGMQDIIFTIPDFSIQRFARGTLSHDVFWEEPKLVAAFRTLEKENRPEEAANVFNQFVYNLKIRSKGATNFLEAFKGTNSQSIVDVMYQSYADSGQKLQRMKRK
jgi:hypothetical protein